MPFVKFYVLHRKSDISDKNASEISFSGFRVQWLCYGRRRFGDQEKMANNPDYVKVHDEYRKKALERAVLYATDPAKVKAILP